MKELRDFREHSRTLVRELGFFRSYYADTDVTSTQAHILLELRANRGASLGELVAAIRMDKSTASRTVRRLVEKGWVTQIEHTGDQREKRFGLTVAGRGRAQSVDARAEATVLSAFDCLDGPSVDIVRRGIELYAKALVRSRHAHEYPIRPLQRADNAAIRSVIARILEAEFDESEEDIEENIPEVQDMFAHFDRPRSEYFVVVEAERSRVVGGAGVAPLPGAGKEVCELQKMYLYKGVRGKGRGLALLRSCLDFARSRGFRECYLDTRATMSTAIALYERSGFERVMHPLGDTGHPICDTYYRMSL